jgi:N utilization substance protein A
MLDNMGNIEILQIVDSVSREKGIPKNNLIDAMEQAIQIAARKKYGMEQNINAQIDHNTGKISLHRIREVVKNVENSFTEITLEDALAIKPDAKIGDEIQELLPPIDLGRVAAQTAKQVIVQKVGEVERIRQYEDYKDRKGDILNGTVKRIEFGSIIVDVGRAEAILPRNQQIRGETFQVGGRIKAYVQDVRREPKGPQIFLSRVDNNFLRKLFEMEVPEIYDHIIEIKGVAREPGSKAKIAVTASDVSIDPVGSCVGVRGSRVRAITTELAGEKIDVINWDKNVAQFVINAMTPAEITKIVFDEERGRVEVVVPNDQLSMAIGRRGQNVRLASKITGWDIDVMTEEQESTRRGEEFSSTTTLFTEHLQLDEVLAQLLAAEGYNSVEQIAYAPEEELLQIEGFDKELVAELKNHAINYMEQQTERVISSLEKLGVEQELLDVLDLPAEYILKLAEFGIKTLEDLADVTVSELREVLPANVISNVEIEDLINFAKEQEAASDEEGSSSKKEE